MALLIVKPDYWDLAVNGSKATSNVFDLDV